METKDIIATRFANDLAKKLAFTEGDRPTTLLWEKSQNRANELLKNYRLRYPGVFTDAMRIKVHIVGEGIILEASTPLDKLLNGE